MPSCPQPLWIVLWTVHSQQLTTWSTWSLLIFLLSAFVMFWMFCFHVCLWNIFCAEAHIFRASKCFVQNHPFISSPSQQRPGWRCWRRWRRWRRCRTHNSTTSKLPLIVSGRWDHDKQIKTILLFCLYIFFVHWLSNISQANPQDSWQLLV